MINVRDEQRDYISISADKEEEKELLKKNDGVHANSNM